MDTLLIRRRRPIGEPRAAAATAWSFASTVVGPAGAGRICLALAELGFPLDRLRQAVFDPAVDPAGLAAFDLGERFETVVLASHLLNLPDERARTAFLRTAARHGAARARLVLEHHPVDWAETAAETVATPGSAVGMTEVRRHPPFVSAVSTYDIGGRYERVAFTARVLSEHELDAALASAGLARRSRLAPTWLEARTGPFPIELHTARLTLRLPGDEEARLEHEMIFESLDHLWPWFGFRARPPTLVERQELAARQRADAAEGRAATYLVFAGDGPVGKAWFEVDGVTASVGWWLRAGATGQGYAEEAVRALVELALASGVERVEAHTDPDNAASRALAERAGFVLHEIRPDAYDRPDGVRRPECVYVLADRPDVT